MTNIFLISDTHFGQESILQYKDSNGKPLRQFSSIEEMDETIVNNWNSIVQPSDTIYHLGDVVINRKSLKILSRLNGRKKLIMGNHDIFQNSDYLQYFVRLHGSHKLNNFLLTHIPVHPDSIPKWCDANIHGHLHANQINDPRYINVSIEKINYTPIALDSITSLLKK